MLEKMSWLLVTTCAFCVFSILRIIGGERTRRLSELEWRVARVRAEAAARQ
jgi:hypothetical protein